MHRIRSEQSQCHGCIAKHVGARHVVVTDINDYRLELARKMGATMAVRADQVTLKEVQAQVGMVEGFDVGLEMSGNEQAFRDMLENMNHGGRIAILGIPPSQTAIDWNQVIFKGLILKGIYGREMYETWYKMTQLLRSGLDVRPVLTHRFPLEDFDEAFETVTRGQCGKVVLDISNNCTLKDPSGIDHADT